MYDYITTANVKAQWLSPNHVSWSVGPPPQGSSRVSPEAISEVFKTVTQVLSKAVFTMIIKILKANAYATTHQIIVEH